MSFSACGQIVGSGDLTDEKVLTLTVCLQSKNKTILLVGSGLQFICI